MIPLQKSTPFHKFLGASITTSHDPRTCMAHVISFKSPYVLSLVLCKLQASPTKCKGEGYGIDVVFGQFSVICVQWSRSFMKSY